METVTGDADSVEGLDDVVEAVGRAAGRRGLRRRRSPVARWRWARPTPPTRTRPTQLVAAAGEVNPLTAFAMAVQPGLGVRVAMSFESEDQARTNADSRAALASGPAPGQGGDFADRFRLGTVSAEGDVVTMELEPEDGEYILSDLTSGPVLFATC